jgi:phosphocarrier protein FPr
MGATHARALRFLEFSITFNSMNKELILVAPVSGVIYPLERVPDPVFSQKLVGNGISIDPTDNVLRAPCPGEIVQQHAAGHAVTLRADGGVEVLMHVGIDTVSLKGQGFTSRVKLGEKVQTGTPLIEFDLDYIATHAKSLLTEVIISNGETVDGIVYGSGVASVGKTPVLTVKLNGAAPATPKETGPAVTSEAIILPNPNGLHARPAAVLSNSAKSFKADIRLQFGDRSANARSVTSLMALETARGDKVVLVAKGADARQAVDKLSKLIAEGLGDEGCIPAPAPATTTGSPKSAPAPRPKDGDPNLVTGVVASGGIAVGEIYQVRRTEIAIKEQGDSPARERRLLDEAIDKAAGQLEALRAQLQGPKTQAKAAIFAAHAELLEDPDLIDIATSAIAKGKSAAFAWRSAVKAHAERLGALKNELLAQRANDVRDVGERVLELLTGIKREAPSYPANAVLIAEDFMPSDTATMEQGKVLGFATVRGGATSHVAILARALGIPALAGVAPRALELANGTPVILDGSKGTLRLNPSADEVKRLRETQIRQEAQRKENLAHAHEPAKTTDGFRVEVAANLGGVKDADKVVKLGGEGVGLLRSEFLFMERSTAPSEDEQFEDYKAICLALGADRPVIVRTLDVGGDKPLSYLPIPKEENPFLGERGIRIGLDRPEILRTQLRAALRASKFGKLWVMFPMIATIAELRDAKAILAEEASSLGIPPMPCGIMVEVPSVAVMAEVFAQEADFFSIGTNDLTQYTLAMDRGHPKLAPKVDALSPSLLRLIALTVEGAHKHKKFTGVCGGIAGDAQAVPILIGLGVDELSVSVPSIPAIKAQIRRLSYAHCRDLAQRALACRTGDEVRALLPESEN